TGQLAVPPVAGSSAGLFVSCRVHRDESGAQTGSSVFSAVCGVVPTPSSEPASKSFVPKNCIYPSPRRSLVDGVIEKNPTYVASGFNGSVRLVTAPSPAVPKRECPLSNT